ncbi:hypothetical protein EJ076_34850 [Mesorhizobium sp. M7D.F.Ca.US.005.01.1.1]|uniref:hypothetical protein n=1 Tax=Mesorhizobium sp. M7D.F.Ca.US.005.01.1.1 TaxID=2493678 RepID=UPI000F759FDD|nr:hypothetical protein [Mesorhizobium sp. M7D.F.Ca.US.005.01.1.1]AZO45897.1 hypothetical protein EJ076_34850 [Mesorhizobium sp. M7D.F.Ca.US.005.01.1.1]
MKAKTRAQRRGRIRKAGARESNGQLQRPSVAEIRHATVEARMRQHGLTLVQAGDRLAGYEIGRLYLRKQIDLVDVEVCDDYVQTVARFMSLTNPQHPFPKAMDYLMTIKGQGGEPSSEQITRARNRYNEWLLPLRGDQELGIPPQVSGNALMTFHGVVFYDHPAAGNVEPVRECIAALRKKFR